MSTTTTNPVAALAQQEATLATAIVALAERIDQIGGVTIADALTRLSDSVAQAKARLAGAYSQVQALASDLTSEIDGLTADLLEDLAANDLVEAPVSLPLGVLANRVAHATTNGTHATTNGTRGNVRVEKSTAEVGADEMIDLTGLASCQHAHFERIAVDLGMDTERRKCLDCWTVFDHPTKLPTNLDNRESVPQNEPVVMAAANAHAPVEDAQQAAPEEKASGRKTRGRGKKS